MKIVFMGTPDFAVPSLEEVVKAGHDVGYVVTQPDKARNRGKKVQFTPVKETALKYNIPVLQPEKIRKSKDAMDAISKFNPDIIIVIAYGQIIHKELLELPKYGCVNVHGSLLPKLRGASPIQHSILIGEEKTGITLIQMGEGIDTGDMLAKAEISIDRKNSEQLHDELSVLGAKLLVETLPKIERGEIVPEKQDDSLATHASLIYKEDGRIDFRDSADSIERKIRAFDPWPGAFCKYGEETMKIWQAEVEAELSEETPGTILSVSNDAINVACGGSTLKIRQLQMPGKKRMDVKSYLLGNKIEKGTILG